MNTIILNKFDSYLKKNTIRSIINFNNVNSIEENITEGSSKIIFKNGGFAEVRESLNEIHKLLNSNKQGTTSRSKYLMNDKYDMEADDNDDFDDYGDYY
jgi:hypothetical protein